jgi:tetratricopeptide (TPR) repeat protein
MGRLRPVLCVVCLVALAAPSLAAAQPAAPPPDERPADEIARAEELAETARRLYGEGDFAGAVAAYRQAYDVAPTGALLYNIAYIYDRELDLPAVAAEYYRRTLESPDVDPGLMRRATSRLEALRGARTAPALPPPVVPPPSSPSAREIGGWVGVGAGSALFLTGLTLGLVANDRHGDFESSRDPATRRDLRDEGRAMAISGDVLMAVGLAGAVAGTVLLLLPADDRTAGGEVTAPLGWRVEVTPLPAGAVLSVGGAL